MATIVISLLPDGAIPVDQYEETEDGANCPLPTQDEELNDENRQVAVEEANYRGLNTGVAFRSDEVCGNCAAFNQTDDILECIGLDDDMESPPLGYCQIYKFVCQAENTCDSWAEGGPMVSEMQEKYRDNF
jgi:hypothetical protein